MIGAVGCFRMVGFHQFAKRANGNRSATCLWRASSIRDRKEDSMHAMGFMFGRSSGGRFGGCEMSGRDGGQDGRDPAASRCPPRCR